MVDSLLPAAILGLVSGWVAFPRWSLLKLSLVAVAIAAFVAALEPSYGAIVGWHCYGLHEPMDHPRALGLFPVLDFCTAYVVSCFFADIAYRGRRTSARGVS